MALPKGLLPRANGYTFQARIPKKYHAHYPKATIYEKLPTDNRTEAIRLVHERWAKLHQEFARIDATGSILKSIPLDHEADFIIATALHSRMNADEEIRAEGLDDFMFERLEDWIKEADESERLAISRGNLTPHTIDVTSDWLQGYGYEVDTDSEGFRQFALKFMRAQAQATRSIKLRASGEYIETPAAPLDELARVNNNNNKNNEESLESLMEYWLTQSVKSRTSIAEAINIIKKFKAMVGNLKPSEITRKHVAELKDKMLEAKLAPATINKSRGILAAIFSMAEKNGKIDKNPFNGMVKLKVPEKEEDSPYTIQELQIIFNSPVFTQGYRPKRFKGETSYWLPLLGLYTAGRINELGQLYVEDIQVEDDIHYIIIKPDSATNRTVKDNKKRRVPLHPDLIKMGFLEYLAKIKFEGHLQLFPELKVTREGGKLADKFGAWWSGFVRKDLHIARIPQPFHAFRHTFSEHGKRTMTNHEARYKLEGHAINTVGDKYGNKLYPLGTLNDEIKKLNFKGLDLSHLYKK